MGVGVQLTTESAIQPIAAVTARACTWKLASVFLALLERDLQSAKRLGVGQSAFWHDRRSQVGAVLACGADWNAADGNATTSDRGQYVTI